ncbi:TPA: hypothetical protein EYP38_02550 [Candidatus Micrarchaeota archaeon]|nr:hypothetical protein [Candidatus Micrarchaeota archaeon]
MKGRRLATALAISAALHVGVPEGYGQGKAAYTPLKRFAEGQIETIKGKIDDWQLQRARRRLVENAREQHRRGQLQLGKTIIMMEELDAREQGGAPG